MVLRKQILLEQKKYGNNGIPENRFPKNVNNDYMITESVNNRTSSDLRLQNHKFLNFLYIHLQEVVLHKNMCR